MNRRKFLMNMGTSAVGSMFLKASLSGASLMWARSVFAEDASKKIIFVYTPDGAIPDQWHPTGSETNFTLPTMSAPFQTVKDHCIFMNGIDMNNAGHGRTSKALSGDQNTSLDLFLAKTIGATTPFSSLQLGVLSNGHGSLSRLNGSEPSYEDNPLTAFDRIFGAGNSSSEDISTQRTKSILDANRQALSSLRDKLGSFEKSRLDEHTASIEKIETRLDALTTNAMGGVCETPIFNSGSFNGDHSSDVNFETLADLQMDLIVLALKCGLTRVASLMLGNHQSGFKIPQVAVDSDYHQSIHGRPASDYALYRSYFSERMVALINRLRTETDVDGSSLLDNTVILQVTDMGDGRSHSGSNVPFMFAGGSNILNTGKSLSFSSVDYRNVLDTAALAMGVNMDAADYTRYGNGPLSGIVK